MRNILLLIIFTIVLVSFLASPAPVSVEFADVLLISLTCLLGFLCIVITPKFKIYKTEYPLLIAVLMYLSYLLISMLISLSNHVPLLNILRGIGPYINFFPLLFLCMLPKPLLTIKSISVILMVVGCWQAGYQIFLYITHSRDAMNTLGILRSRITLIDPRTTLPIVLALAILPLVIFTKKNKSLNKQIILQSFAIVLILTALFGAVVTLTRSIILSEIMGWGIFIGFYLHHQIRYNHLPLSNIVNKIVLYGIFLVLGILIISSFEKVQLLSQGVLARFYQQTTHHSSDYSNGRLYEEWIPAIYYWLDSNTMKLIFGIGAGNTFIIATGEERSYVHNLLIYKLVFGGIYGLLVSLWLYFTLFTTLIRRARESNQFLYYGFAALFASLFFYGQLFAVHKGLAFNAMLFLMIAIALRPPEAEH